MLDKETIRNMPLISEVDQRRAQKLQFENSDKSAHSVVLGNPDTAREALKAITTATTGHPAAGSEY